MVNAVVGMEGPNEPGNGTFLGAAAAASCGSWRPAPSESQAIEQTIPGGREMDVGLIISFVLVGLMLLSAIADVVEGSRSAPHR